MFCVGVGNQCAGTQVHPNSQPEFYKEILQKNLLVSLEDAIFRKEVNFMPANLQIFMNFGSKKFGRTIHTRIICSNGLKELKLDSVKEFPNNISDEFIFFMDKQVEE